MKLPDCEDVFDESVSLTRNEWQDIVKRLAEDGEKGIDDFIKEMAKRKDSSIAKRFEQIRKRLKKQSEEVMERKQRSLSEEMTRERERWENYLERIESERTQMLKEEKGLDRDLNKDLKQLILDDEIVKLVSGTPPGKDDKEPGFLSKVAIALRNLFYKIGRTLARFWLWLKLKLGLIKPHEVKREKGRRISFALTFPEASDALSSFDEKFSNALMTDPKVNRLVKRRLKGSKVSKSGHLSGDRYVTEAKSQISKDLVKKRREYKKRVAKRRETLINRLDELSRNRERAKKELARHPEETRKRYSDLLERFKERLKSRSKATVKKRLVSQLKASNYIRQEGGKIIVTEHLVKRFATLVFTKEIKNLAYSHHFVTGGSDSSLGLYQRARPISVYESSRMDIVSSLVESRLHHPGFKGLDDDDIIVHREVKGSQAHVVLIYDRSGSMDENQRIGAAKRAVLAIYEAVKRDDPRNIVDIIALDTNVSEIDLLGVWRSEPQGFTNTGESLRVANELLRDSPATFRLVYLITDGLPEAYTSGGKAFAGNPEKSLDYALAQAKKLAKEKRCRFTIIMLEPKEQLYIDAAKKIARAARGSMITTDPQKLASEMLMDYVKVR